MPTLGDPWTYNISERFHAYRTLNVGRGDHVIPYDDYISPCNSFIGIEEIFQIGFTILVLDHELHGGLNKLFLVEVIILSCLPLRHPAVPRGPLRTTFGPRGRYALLLFLLEEAEEVIGALCVLRVLIEHIYLVLILVLRPCVT